MVLPTVHGASCYASRPEWVVTRIYMPHISIYTFGRPIQILTQDKYGGQWEEVSPVSEYKQQSSVYCSKRRRPQMRPRARSHWAGGRDRSMRVIQGTVPGVLSLRKDALVRIQRRDPAE